MDLDSRAYSKLFIEYNTYGDSEEYKRIFDAKGSLLKRHDHKTPEMWCSRIRNPFRKILEENPRIFSKNGVCDSLVFTPYKYAILVDDSFQDSHLKRCISGNTISNKHAIRNEILKSIDIWEYQICFVPFYCNDPYKQVKMEENTMPSTPKFESACISPTRQRDVSVPEIRNLWND
ncbi:hypothetical protein GLOIN_2v1591372 [Rhizophagus clarus]|uniref:Uncharacterized protein n=1 Tax=Rhizophagus clarus TaxID=94130 RepID=A0A8H3QAT6_9GLOM|nr:hypothetical protein GLOIN_2v1591372 [Rhizophagus clarus]